MSLSVVNSCPPATKATPSPGKPGWGSLIETCVIQLDGQIEHRRMSDRYELHLSFALAWLGEGDDEDAPRSRCAGGPGEPCTASCADQMQKTEGMHHVSHDHAFAVDALCFRAFRV